MNQDRLLLDYQSICSSEHKGSSERFVSFSQNQSLKRERLSSCQVHSLSTDLRLRSGQAMQKSSPRPEALSSSPELEDLISLLPSGQDKRAPLVLLTRWDLSNRLWQKMKARPWLQALLVVLLYLVPLSIRLYIYFLTDFLVFLQYFNIIYLTEKVLHAFDTSSERKTLQHYFLLSQLWQQLVYKALVGKLLFQHRYKRWPSERISHKVNRFDRLLFSSRAVETALMTALNPMTLQSHHYRRRIKVEYSSHLAFGILKRLLICVLPFELSVLALFLFNKASRNPYSQVAKVLILLSFLYKSFEVFFQLFLVLVALYLNQDQFHSINYLVVGFGLYELAVFLLLSGCLMAGQVRVNQKSIKNDLIS